MEETCEENFFEQEGERGTEERGEELKSSKFCSAQKAQRWKKLTCIFNRKVQFSAVGGQNAQNENEKWRKKIVSSTGSSRVFSVQNCECETI